MPRSEHIVTYDTFTRNPEIPAVEADAVQGNEPRNAISDEDKYALPTVFPKFDQQFGVHRFCSIKRQEFLQSRHGEKQSVPSWI